MAIKETGPTRREKHLTSTLEHTVCYLCPVEEPSIGLFKSLLSSLLFECYCKKCSISEGFIPENFGKNGHHK